MRSILSSILGSILSSTPHALNLVASLGSCTAYSYLTSIVKVHTLVPMSLHACSISRCHLMLIYMSMQASLVMPSIADTYVSSMVIVQGKAHGV